MLLWALAMHWRDKMTLYWLLLGLAAGGCGDAQSTKSLNGAPDYPSLGAANDAGTSGGDFSPEAPGAGNGGAGSGATNLPPEKEEQLSFDTPQAGKTAVYVPNPATNRVAVVNAQNFSIETLASGSAPTYTATVPGQDVAIVINVGSQDASLLRTKDGKTTAHRLAVGHEANAIAVAPDGKHAVLYFNASATDALASSFQDVTIVGLETDAGTSRGVSVGFKPRDVKFTSDGARAFVITDDGISVIELTTAAEGPQIARLVSVGDKVSDPVSNDVQVTPDGAFAFARRDGDTAIRRVDLATGVIQSLDLTALQSTLAADGGVASTGLLAPGTLDLTDLDLAPDGSFLIAVVRSHGALLRIPVPAGFDDPTKIEATFITDQLVGSVSLAKTGKLGIAYTTVENIEGVVLVDLVGNSAPRGVRLRKAVRAVALSDDGTRALVLHTALASADQSTPEGRIDAKQGYSLLDTGTGFAKLQLTDAAIRERDILVLPDASRMFALVRDDNAGVRSLEEADLGSFEVSSLPLAKPPSSIGRVPGLERIFVGQESEGGMITFVDAKTGAVAKAVSGFELASRIQQ